jgi:acyl-CoA thioesterase-2
MADFQQAQVRELETLLTVEPAGNDMFIGQRQAGDVGRIFGGEIIAQALAAATKTVEPDRIIHSLHAYFIRPGDVSVPAHYQVARDSDGRSFSTRRVTASQNGDVILNLACSFQTLEAGLSHQVDMPADIPAPDALRSEDDMRLDIIDTVPEAVRENFMRPRVVDIRPIGMRSWMNKGPQPPVQQSWVRLVAPIGDDPQLHRTMLAYISDMQLLGTCSLPHGLNWISGELVSASLDHAIWFHDDFRADDWLYFQSDSPWSNRGRGLNHAKFYARDGRLVASVAQEGMIRRRRK